MLRRPASDKQCHVFSRLQDFTSPEPQELVSLTLSFLCLITISFCLQEGRLFTKAKDSHSAAAQIVSRERFK